MISVENTLISSDIADECFECDVTVCKGECCRAGCLGAPLENEELEIINKVYKDIKPFLTEAGQKAIEKQGKYVFDSDNEYSTTLIPQGDCAYSYLDENGALRCVFEKVHNLKLIKFQKPISCHLYPIRVSKHKFHDALNYHEWKVCEAAAKKGNESSTFLYQFLKKPLIRKYGLSWYKQLVNKIKQR